MGKDVAWSAGLAKLSMLRIYRNAFISDLIHQGRVKTIKNKLHTDALYTGGLLMFEASFVTSIHSAAVGQACH